MPSKRKGNQTQNRSIPGIRSVVAWNIKDICNIFVPPPWNCKQRTTFFFFILAILNWSGVGPSNQPIILDRGVVPGDTGCATPRDRSVNPISTRVDRLCPPNYYWHPQIFRPSDGPARGKNLYVHTSTGCPDFKFGKIKLQSPGYQYIVATLYKRT